MCALDVCALDVCVCVGVNQSFKSRVEEMLLHFNCFPRGCETHNLQWWQTVNICATSFQHQHTKEPCLAYYTVTGPHYLTHWDKVGESKHLVNSFGGDK